MSDLIFHAGAECYDLYGTLSKRTSIEEDVAETFTRTSTAYYVDRNGVLRLAEANVLRTEWTGSDFDVPTLLLEDARTNGWTYSEQLNQGVWTKSNLSVSSDDEVAPDGTTTADKLVENTASGAHRIQRTFSATNDTDQAISCFWRADEVTLVAVGTVAKDGSFAVSYFNLATGELGTVAGSHTARMTALANSWYRCEVVYDVAAGGSTPEVQLLLTDNTETVSYTGDGSSGAHLWGVQIGIDKSFVSSYVKTVAGTVTRNAETLYFPFDAPPQEMTMYVSFIERGTLAVSFVPVVMLTNSSGADPAVQLDSHSSGKYRVRLDNNVDSETSAVLGVAPSIGDAVELRGTIGSDGAVTIGQSINSGAETTASSAGPSSGLPSAWADTRLYVNSRGSVIGFNALQSIKIARGTKTMAEMRQLGV